MDSALVRDLFFRALQLGPGDRERFLSGSAPSAEIRDQVLALLRYDMGSETFLTEAIAAERPPAPEGGRFGVYGLRELLGRGGMGAVYRGERADDELRQTVAIKVIERAWLDPHVMERFRSERQILAGLEHPNIARLIDGGTRDDGIPYLVMEYVEGQPIHRYCAEHGLGIAERLRVFLPLCEAVEYAHRKLVVHRDLKPSNVLVTPEGSPKLLDFGVAKAIDPGASRQTQTIVLTPDFASPEQYLGREITTATDVYGLGAVLYHLLTDSSPHHVTGMSPGELERAICHVGPVRPSALKSELAGDLENILLKALDPDPSRRYGSARELAEDIGRYLDHRPVHATPYRWWYGAYRLAQRHRAGSIAACLAATVVLTATVVSIQEARRAQRRFEQVRALANRFLFEFESSIHDLPATLEARRMVASTAREYLQSLSGDARGNSALTRELAEAHYKLSRVEVGAGQSAAALADGEKALAMLREVKADRSAQPRDRAVFLRALTDLARSRMSTRDVKGARPLSDEALNNAQDWARRSPGSVEAERALVDALTTKAGVAEMAGELTAARQAAAQGVELSRDAARRHPDDDAFGYGHGRALSILARICVTLQDGPCAIESGAGAEAVLGRLVKHQPDNVLWRDVLAMSVGDQASGLAFLAEKDPVYRQPAVDAARRAYTLSRENARRNPDSIEEADTANLQAMRLAIALNRAGRNSEAERFAHEADVTAGELVARDPKNHRFHRTQINTRALLGEMLMEHAQWNASAKTLASAESLADDYLRDDPQNRIALDLKVSAVTDQAIVLRHFGRLDAARDDCRKALDIAAALISRDPSIARAMGDLEKARRLARELGLPDPTTAAGAKR